MTTSPAEQWLLEEGAPPVRYRTVRDILDRPPDAAARREVLSYRPALAVTARQRPDGTWGGRIHSGDSRGDVRLTTEIQFPRLVEYGWEPGVEAVDRGTALLLKLLGDDPPDWYDLGSYMRGSRRSGYVKWFCRSIAASLLAHAGLGSAGPVAAVARRLLDASYRFVTGPAAAVPVAGDPPVIRREAYDEELGYPAIPDLYLLALLAHCPSARSGSEQGPKLRAVMEYVFGDAYARLDRRIGLVALEGRPFVKGWKIVLPEPEVLVRRKMGAYGLVVLELFARLGEAGRRPATARWLQWLEDHQLRPGVYDLPTSAFSRSGPFAERVRLAPDWMCPRRRAADITFRVRLIHRLLGTSSPVT